MAQIFSGTEPSKKALENTLQGDIVFLLVSKEAEELSPLLPFPIEQLAHWKAHSSSFESHTGADCISLRRIHTEKPLRPAEHIGMFLTEHRLILLFSEVSSRDRALAQFQKEADLLHTANAERVLYLFLSGLISGDPEALQTLEQEITTLEEQLLTAKKDDCIREIISLRKRLMHLKGYYEQLLEICEALEENENGLIEEPVLRSFHILTGRAGRLLRAVEQLRDYVTQVREAYQAQVDINSNNIMRIFTVLTAIFLPLSLVAGWYGMNLQMPEYGWNLGYPVVILVSVLVVALCIFLFKRKKWF